MIRKFSSQSSLLYRLIFLVNITLIFINQAMCLQIDFPPNTVIRVTDPPYNADPGDNDNNDTEAIRKAIKATLGKDMYLYFPTGVYNVSGRIDWINSGDEWDAGLHLIGQNKEQTIIKIRDDFTGDVLFYTGSKKPTPSGGGVTGWKNSFSNFTIDFGESNTGVTGIDWMCNNDAAIRHLHIKGNGNIGILFKNRKDQGAVQGPCLVQDLMVDGSNIAVSVDNEVLGIFMEKITLKDQKQKGIHIAKGNVAIRQLNSSNLFGKKVIENDFSGSEGLSSYVTLIDAKLSAPNGAQEALEIDGRVFLRNVRVTGYDKVGFNDEINIPNDNNVVGEYVGIGDTDDINSESTQLVKFRQFHGPYLSLGLPVKETPFFHINDHLKWNIGLKGSGDSKCLDEATLKTDEINSALSNTNNSVVYFGPGTYCVNKRLTVPAHIQQIVGNGAHIMPVGPSFDNPNDPTPLWDISAFSNQPLIIQNFRIINSYGVEKDKNNNQLRGTVVFNHNTERDVVIKDILFYKSPELITKPISVYLGYSFSGNLFIENIMSTAGWTGWNFKAGQNVWARQFNLEGEKLNATNDGANLWIFGVKTENRQTVLRTMSGGKTELIGAVVFRDSGLCDAPTFEVDNSQVSLGLAIYEEHGNYPQYVKEIKYGKEKDLTTTKIVRGKSSGGMDRAWIPLYVSHDGCGSSNNPIINTIQCLTLK